MEIEAAILVLGIYLLAMNALGFFVMAQDKMLARGSGQNPRRYSEGALFFLAILGGSAGIYAGMIALRHKTQKIYFLIGIPALIVQQLLLLSSFSFFLK